MKKEETNYWEADLAQLVERTPFKRVAEGSIPPISDF